LAAVLLSSTLGRSASARDPFPHPCRPRPVPRGAGAGRGARDTKATVRQSGACGAHGGDGGGGVRGSRAGGANSVPRTRSTAHAASDSPCAWQRPQRRYRQHRTVNDHVGVDKHVIGNDCGANNALPDACRVCFAVCVAAATTSASTRTALSTTTLSSTRTALSTTTSASTRTALATTAAPTTCPTHVPRLLRSVRSGGHNVGVDTHRIVNDGSTNNALHGACCVCFAVYVAAATTSASTRTALSTTAAPTTRSTARAASASPCT